MNNCQLADTHRANDSAHPRCTMIHVVNVYDQKATVLITLMKNTRNVFIFGSAVRSRHFPLFHRIASTFAPCERDASNAEPITDLYFSSVVWVVFEPCVAVPLCQQVCFMCLGFDSSTDTTFTQAWAMLEWNHSVCRMLHDIASKVRQ